MRVLTRGLTSGLARIACLLALMLAVQWLAPAPAGAAMVTTDQVVGAAAASGDDRLRIKSLLAREELRGELEALGILPDEAIARVDSLSDEEIAMIAGKLDALPAGEGVGLVLVLLLVILLIVLLL